MTSSPSMTAVELSVADEIREAAQYLSGRRMRVSRTLGGLSGALYGLPLSYLTEEHRMAIGACAATVRRAQRYPDEEQRVARMREGLRFLERAITTWRGPHVGVAGGARRVGVYAAHH